MGTDKIAALRATVLFGSLTNEELRALASLCTEQKLSREQVFIAGPQFLPAAAFERDSFPRRLAPLSRRCRSADRRVNARRRSLPTVGLIFLRRSARIRSCCVSGNPSALVLPSIKHFFLQTISSDRISHRCVLLSLSSVLNQRW
jgi:hypothetical protein